MIQDSGWDLACFNRERASVLKGELETDLRVGETREALTFNLAFETGADRRAFIGRVLYTRGRDRS